MKKLFQIFFNGSSKAEKQITLAQFHQPDVLQDKMVEAGMTHGHTVMANLKGVRLQNEGGIPRLYFCPMKEVSILETICSGDGKPIPKAVTLQSPFFLKGQGQNGKYNLENVLLTSNGTIQVTATEKTRFELVHAED